MRNVIKIIFVLAFLALNFCLLNPLVNRGMSWVEAGFGIIPGALVALICFVLLLAGVGAKGRSRSSATRLWASALVWSLLLGGIVTLVSFIHLQDDKMTTFQEGNGAYSRSSSTSLQDSYARYDQIGMIYGGLTLGFAGLSLFGLIFSLVLKKSSQTNISAT